MIPRIKNKLKMVLIVFLILCTYYANASDKITLPFEITKNRLMVKVRTNSDTLNFIFDSASTTSVIDSTIARKYNLKFGAKSQFSTLGGEIPSYNTEFELWENTSNMNWVIFAMDKISEEIGCHVDGLIGAHSLICDNIIEINFNNHEIQIGNNISVPKDIDNYTSLFSANKSNSGLGKYLPKFPAIRKTVLINKNYFIDIDLIIDTGSKFGLSFISGDSIDVRPYISSINNYNGLRGDIKIGFCKAQITNVLNKDCFEAPIFVNQRNSKLFNNKLFGLLGVPFLKQHEKIILNWPEKKIIFIPDLF